MAAVLLLTAVEKDEEVKKEPPKKTGLRKWHEKRENCRSPVVDSNEGPK